MMHSRIQYCLQEKITFKLINQKTRSFVEQSQEMENQKLVLSSQLHKQHRERLSQQHKSNHNGTNTISIHQSIQQPVLSQLKEKSGSSEQDHCLTTDIDRPSPTVVSNQARGKWVGNKQSSFEPLSVGTSKPQRQHCLEENSHYLHRKQSEHTSKDYIAATSSLDNVSPVTRHPQNSLRHQSSIEKEILRNRRVTQGQYDSRLATEQHQFKIVGGVNVPKIIDPRALRLMNSQTNLPRAEEANAKESSRCDGYGEPSLGQAVSSNATHAVRVFRSSGSTQRQENATGGSLHLNVNVVSSTGLGLENGESLHMNSNHGRTSVLAPPPSHIQLNSNVHHVSMAKQIAFGNHGIQHQSTKNVAASQSAGGRKQSVKIPSPSQTRDSASPDKVGVFGINHIKTSVINPQKGACPSRQYAAAGSRLTNHGSANASSQSQAMGPAPKASQSANYAGKGYIPFGDQAGLQVTNGIYQDRKPEKRDRGVSNTNQLQQNSISLQNQFQQNQDAMNNQLAQQHGLFPRISNFKGNNQFENGKHAGLNIINGHKQQITAQTLVHSQQSAVNQNAGMGTGVGSTLQVTSSGTNFMAQRQATVNGIIVGQEMPKPLSPPQSEVQRRSNGKQFSHVAGQQNQGPASEQDHFRIMAERNQNVPSSTYSSVNGVPHQQSIPQSNDERTKEQVSQLSHEGVRESKTRIRLGSKSNMNTAPIPNAMQPNINGHAPLNAQLANAEAPFMSPLAQQQLGRKSDQQLDNFEPHGLQNFNSNAESAQMKQGVGQLSEHRICYTDKYNTNAYPQHQGVGSSGDSVGNALAVELKENHIGSQSKPGSLVRNNAGPVPNVNTGAPAGSGMLVSKDDIFQKNKTFNYPKESSTTRGEQMGVETRRQRSSKAPQHVSEAAQLKQAAVGEGHYTPQLMMSSQSESRQRLLNSNHHKQDGDPIQLKQQQANLTDKRLLLEGQTNSAGTHQISSINRQNNPYPTQSDPNVTGDSAAKRRPSSYNEFQRSSHNSGINSPGSSHYAGHNTNHRDPISHTKQPHGPNDHSERSKPSSSQQNSMAYQSHISPAIAGSQHPQAMVQTYQQAAARQNALQGSAHLRGDVQSQRQSAHQVMQTQQHTLQSSPQMQTNTFANVQPQQTSTSQQQSQMNQSQTQQSKSGQAHSTSQSQSQQPQQQPKIPVICGFHKQMLLLTCQYFTQSNGPGQSGYNPNAPGAGMPTGKNPNQGGNSHVQLSQIRRIRNKNPNCNHNSNSVFYQPHYNNVKYDDTFHKKEDVLRKVFFKECAKEEERRGVTTNGLVGSSLGGQALNHNGIVGQPTAMGNAGAQIMKPNKNDPHTHLRIIDHILSEFMFVKEQIDRSKPLTSAQSLLLELELERVHSAHKAFLLALIRSGKINTENLLKVLAEVKQSGSAIDTECIYCKYSQFALKESNKVGLLQQQQLALQQQQNPNGASTQQQNEKKPDIRIEHLVKMFQSQLFKKSFITTSLLIIQRRMNDKYFVRQRNNQQREGQTNVPASTYKKPAPPVPKKKEPAAPKLTNLENLQQQITKLSKNLANPKDKERYLELKEKYYREFLAKINKSNSFDNKFPTASFTPYKYYIGKGNNSILVRAALKTRFWWSMGDYEDWGDYQFMWTQWKSNKILDCIKPFKEIKEANEKDAKRKEGAESLMSTQPTDKESNSSVENLITTPKRSKQQALSSLKKANTSVSSSGNKASGKMGIGAKNGSKEEEDKDKKEENHTSHHMITTNHQENNFHLSNKKAIWYNMKIYYESLGLNPFDYMPLTFHIKEGENDREFLKFLEVYKNPQIQPDLIKYPRYGTSMWIIKPGENTNRGTGIQVSRDINHIKSIVNQSQVGGKKRSYIVQKYIEKPFLYKNRKFDIRTYALTTTINGNLQGYWYSDGYLRTCSREYSLKNDKNRMVHLTNDAVQKKGDDYGKFESGNKLSYTEFQKYLDNVNVKVEFVKTVVPKMKALAADTIKAVSRKMDPNRRNCSFEIFGYDFMIDEDMKPWLIEVNTNPCLELASPYLARLIPAMLENSIKIAIDPIFLPPPIPNSKKHQIPDAMDNKFELVFNERDDGAELKNLPIDDTMHGIIEEEELEDEVSDEENEAEAD